MRGTKIGILTLTAAALVLTGCSTGDGDGTTTTPSASSGTTDEPDDSASPGATGGGEASDDLIGWAASLCTAIGPFEERFAGLSTLSPTDPADASAYVEQVLDAFGAMGGIFSDARAAIEDSGPPPIEGGDEVQANLLDALDAASAGFDQLASELEGIDPEDPDAMAQIGAVFENLMPSVDDSINELDATFSQPDMVAAFDAAPECEGITDTGVMTGVVVRVHLGSDHAGYALKAVLVDWLGTHGYELVDHGPPGYDAEDDYPPYVLAAASAVAGEPGTFGIVIGGSGNGEAIAANKVAGVRAALAWTETTARLAREHNDANVLSLGARQYGEEDAIGMVATFLTTSFSGDPRHVRRLAQVADYERSGVVPDLPT